MTNYLNLTLTEINELLKLKKIKPIDLVNEAFNKIESSNLNAFITLNKEQAIKKALELENVEPDNLLFGIPVAIKDNIVTKDLRTTAASKMLENFNPVYDATVIKKIKDANMIIIGKTNMDEFAMGSTGETSYFGPTLNPVDNKLVPGGSSSGSAAAVKAGLSVLALGSDTGGSVRQPAGFTGIVGLKPSYGRISRYGLIAFASSIDQIGPFSKTVLENALFLNLISGYDELDSTTVNTKDEDFTRFIGENVKDMKIGIPNYYIGDAINKEVKERILKIEEMLKESGATVEHFDLDYLEYAIPLYQTIALGEASSNLARFDGIRYGHVTDSFNTIEELYKKSRAEGFGDEVKRRIMIGSYVLSGENAHEYYEKAQKVRHLMSDSFQKAFEKYDLLIGPVSTDVAYPLGIKTDDALKSFYDDILTIPANMAGLPALSIPAGLNSNNLPIGLQIIGPKFDEATVYKLGAYIETMIKGEF